MLCCVIERSLSLAAAMKSRKQRPGIVVLLLVTAALVAAAHCIELELEQYQDSPLSSWFNSWPLETIHSQHIY